MGIGGAGAFFMLEPRPDVPKCLDSFPTNDRYGPDTDGDGKPDMERGGPDGALIFYGHHTTDGRMYELLDDDLEVVHTVTLDEMIETWENA